MSSVLFQCLLLTLSGNFIRGGGPGDYMSVQIVGDTDM
jgi:hypothetical protein